MGQEEKIDVSLTAAASYVSHQGLGQAWDKAGTLIRFGRIV